MFVYTVFHILLVHDIGGRARREGGVGLSLPKIFNTDYDPYKCTKSYTKVQHLSPEISNMQLFVLTSKSLLI